MLAHGGGFLQSHGWARFQESIGRETFRFRVADESSGDVVMQCSVIANDIRFGKKYLYAPRGPVIATGMTDAATAVELTASFRALLLPGQYVFGKIELPFLAGTHEDLAATLRSEGFAPSAPLQPQHTAVLDLQGDEATILERMHSKTRYNIRVAERHGVTVREARYSTVEDFKKDATMFLELLLKTAERDEFSTHSRSYYEKLLSALAPGVDASLRARLFIAEHEGAPVAAGIFLEFGDTMTYLHGASSYAHRQLMAPYALHWHAIKKAREAGLRKYDFWGVAPDDSPKHPWAGVTRFKMGFGGDRVAYAGAWELPGNRFWYSVYAWIKKMH